jgi:AcrR family transcriptional regulator
MTHSSTSSPGAPTRTPLTARGQRTRQKLVEAAEAEFAELGYERASISGIVGRAEVAQGTFYVYFEDKQSIFVELVDSLGARLRSVLAQAVRGCKHRLEVEREGLRAFLTFTAEHRGLYRIVPQAEFVDEECYRRYYRTLAKGYTKGLEQAMKRGELRGLDPEVTAHCLMGLNDMIGLNFVLWRPHVRIDELVEQVMDFVSHGIAVRGGRRAAAGQGKKKTLAKVTRLRGAK